MRDLYKRIGLPNRATKDQIERMLAEVHSERDREEIRHILMTDNRRRVYDRSYHSLKQIGKLRANLGLQQGSFWLSDKFSDFDVTPRAGNSLLDRVNAHAKSGSASTSTPPASPSEVAPGESMFGELPASVQQRLRNRQSKRVSEQARLRTHGLFGKLISIVLLCASFLLLFAYAAESKWSSEITLICSALTLIVSWYVGKHIFWVYRWLTAKVKCYLYITPVYFIETYLDEVRWWPIWSLQDIKITHHHKNGSYEHTSLHLKLADEERDFEVRPKAAVENWLEVLKKFDVQIRAAINRKNWDHIAESDDFRGVRSSSITPNSGNARFVIQGLAMLIGVAFLGAAIQINDQIPTYRGFPPQPRSAYTPPQPRTTYPSPKPVFNAAPQPLPEHGAGIIYFDEPAVAPLEIRTRGFNNHYFVKLTDWYTDEPLVVVFIRAGQSLDFNVPLGSYRLKYATGTTWYGENLLFGPETSYSQADRRFDFVNLGYEISGYTVELFLQSNGNLSTSRIAPGEW